MTGLASILPHWWSVTKTQFTIAVLIVLAGAAAAFPISYLSGSNFLIGLILFPFILIAEGKARYNFIYIGVSVLFAIAAFAYNVRMFYFLSVSFAVIALTEIFCGRVNPIIVFLIAAMSPVFNQVAGILGFPIRLTLSEVAGTMLQRGGLDVSVEGNVLSIGGSTFAVDDACMGLNMLAIALLLSLFLLATEFKRTGRSLSFIYVLGYFMVVFVLNVLTNLFRIVVLVLFRIGPDDPMHEIVGITALVFYCIVPMYYIAKLLVRKKAQTTYAIKPATLPKRNLAIVIFFCVSLAGVGFSINPIREGFTSDSVYVSGMEAISMADGMSKFSSEQYLIYVKPIPEFFSGEHTPMFCWKGSGYEFEKISTSSIGGYSVYSGVLQKGQERLHTAWWYTNGEVNTIDQFKWRLTSLKTGRPFYLVNVTAADHNQLTEKVASLFAGGLRIVPELSDCL